MNAAAVRVGDVIAGKYRVDRVLGAGGMGVVVAATHRELGEARAIKLMHREALSNVEAVERFLREARAATRLKSEHVTKVYEVGRLKDSAPYMVMEQLEGSDLRAVLKERGALPVPEAVDYVLQACEALAEAHARGIIHRDLKPANLFLVRRRDGSPCVKVLDFGISKIMSEAGGDNTVTRTHAVLGSPHYMSPEQMRSTRDVDQRADLWSLGVLLYQLLAGRVPFPGRTITDIITEVLQTTPAPLEGAVPGVTPALDAAILHCLEKDPAQRCPDVDTLATALAPFASPAGARSVAAIHRLASGRAPLPSASDGPGSQRPPPPASTRAPSAPSWTVERVVLAVLLVAIVVMGLTALARARWAPRGTIVPSPAAHS
jgi:serine/threonine-protein kinase